MSLQLQTLRRLLLLWLLLLWRQQLLLLLLVAQGVTGTASSLRPSSATIRGACFPLQLS